MREDDGLNWNSEYVCMKTNVCVSNKKNEKQKKGSFLQHEPTTSTTNTARCGHRDLEE